MPLHEHPVSIEYTSSATRIIPHLNPLRMVCGLWKNRGLIRVLSIREIQGRYKGSYLGLSWAILHPLVNLAIYTFIFGVIFKSRWDHANGTGSLAEFALILFSGQVAYQLFSEPVGKAPTLMLVNINYIKKVVFPLEILPVANIFSTAFHVLLAATCLIGATLVINGAVPWTVALAPVSFLPLLLLGLGASWLISSLGVYLRDMKLGVELLLKVLFFISPIVYPVSSVPENYRLYVELNPLTPGLEVVRGCMILGELPPLTVWGAAFAWGGTFLILGYTWFMITRKGFADVT